jgi:hypothetical protein
MFVKLTTFVPLMLNTPVVLKVTGSASAAHGMQTPTNAATTTLRRDFREFATM